MRFYRVKLSSWTSSFRYPNVISGYQPTLEVPPVSTILGLVNACAGSYLEHKDTKIGYYFEYGSKAVDLETIYQYEIGGKNIPKNKVKSNVLRREFLYECNLYLYLTDPAIVDHLRHPFYSILLGRSNDLATIEKIEEVELPEIENACKIKGQMIPFNNNYLPGTLQALPLYFTDSIPRRNIGTEPFSVISCYSPDYPTQLTAYRDVINEKELDIYIHHLHLKNG